MLGSEPVLARKLNRALIVALAASAALAPAAAAKPKGFSYGVTAADVSKGSAILWAKANRSGTVLAQIKHRGNFGACSAKKAAAKVKAKQGHDNTVRTQIEGLKSDTSYRYRFCTTRGGHSATGRFSTAPAKKDRATIRFALSGDQDARPVPGGTTPYWNDFGVWKRIVGEQNDFNVLMGDTIYSDTEVPGYTLSDVALTKQQKWAAYKTNLGQKRWTKARGSAAYYAHFDDHEFVNDFSTFENSFPLSVGDVNIDGDTLYKRGLKAFEDYNPTAYSKQTGIYRSVRWGKNLEIFFLDERSFRSASSDYGGACDNPPGSGDADLAPTAPQSTRNLFSVIVPQLANPVPPDCLASINDPSRTMLGSKQLKQFKQAVSSSGATFKVIFNEVPIQQYYALPYDRWEGYAAEREALLHYLADKADNVVFLTTDVHANLVNDARYDTLGPGGVQNSGLTEATTGPVATASYSEEIEAQIGNPNGGALIHDAFLKPQPPNGVGMQCAATDQFSYAEVTVTGSRLEAELLDQDGNPVQDTGDRDVPGPPCSAVVIDKQ